MCGKRLFVGMTSLFLFSGEMMSEFDREKNIWEKEFAASMCRPLAVRIRYSFIRTYKPVLDDATYRSFERMADYRQWCETNLPTWLGYGRV